MFKDTYEHFKSIPSQTFIIVGCLIVFVCVAEYFVSKLVDLSYFNALICRVCSVIGASLAAFLLAANPPTRKEYRAQTEEITRYFESKKETS